MSQSTFVYYRHKTDKQSSIVDLLMLSNKINKSISFEIEKGDEFDFNDLMQADQVAIKSFTDNVPEKMTVEEIVLEDNLEIKDGIRKVFLGMKS